MKKLILFTFLTASLVPVRAQTAIVYVPSGAQSQPGNAVLVPYQWEYQQLFDASLFSSLPPGGGVIRGLSLRPSVRSPSKEAELSGIIIELSTTMKTIGSLSPIFAENTGSDNQVYWSGRSVRWISGGVEDGTPQRWSPGFGDLAGKGFSYDPSKGNLLMRIRNLQLPDGIIVLGYVGGGLVRGFLVGGAVTIVSLIFTQLAVHHAFVIFAAVVLTSVVFSLGGFLNAMFAKNFDQVNWIPTFVLTPLTYFGGVFYSISLLPEWARHISYANPILHMVNAFRYGFLGTSDVNVYAAFGIMLASAGALFAVALFFMHRGTGMRE